METRSFKLERFLRIKVVAALSVVALVVIAFAQGYSKISQGGRILSAVNAPVGAFTVARTPYGSVNWQAPLETSSPLTGQAPESADGSGVMEEDKDGISNIADNVMGALVGSYVTLAENGSYTPEEGEKIAEDIAASLKASVSYPIYSQIDIKTDTDTSYERMLTYRNDLRIALEPLLKNPGYELSLFANYIESRDARYLEQLRETATNYRLAIESAGNVVVPEDAASQHVGILNALSEFGAIVGRLSKHADDAFASAALLRTYNDSEANLVISFDSLASYYKSKHL